MYVLGILNCANKDSGAALIHCSKSGQVLKYVGISEERLARVKNGYFSPVRSIQYCLQAMGLNSIAQIDLVVTDWVAEKRLLNSNPTYRKLESDYVISRLRIPRHKIMFAESHHMAHAASTYYPSGFNDAAILIIDGAGSDLETVSLFKGADGKITLVDRAQHFGVGQLYTAVSKRILGFSTGEEGKTMGLAPYGRNKPGPILNIQPKYDGLFLDYSRFMDRLPETGIKQNLSACTRSEDVTNDYYARIAYDVQHETEQAILHLARHALKVTGARKLCLAGGVALNCVANHILLEESVVDDLFVQPASSDTGIPFGLALLGCASYSAGRLPGQFAFPNAYTGRNYRREEICELLDRFDLPQVDVQPAQVANLVANGNVVGWFTGGSEFGPRALGHRSILADPRNPHIRDVMNAKVKHRELFRPFAPSVLAEHTERYFQLNGRMSPFMLLAPQASEEAKASIPAVVHVDGTARVQTVTPENGRYHDLLVAFNEITGTPVVLNTSFNDNGEPIVEAPIDALICFLRTRIDYLYLDGLLLSKADLKSCLPELLSAVEAYRDRSLLEKYQEAVEACCNHYDVREMASYLLKENTKARYYSHYQTWDSLNGIVEQWLMAPGVSYGVVTDKRHWTLFQAIPGAMSLSNLKVVVSEDHHQATHGIDTSSLMDCQAVLVLLYTIGEVVCRLLSKACSPNTEVHHPYGRYARKLPGENVVFAFDVENRFEQLADISFEAKRDKNWDQFFVNAERALSDASGSN